MTQPEAHPTQPASLPLTHSSGTLGSPDLQPRAAASAADNRGVATPPPALGVATRFVTRWRPPAPLPRDPELRLPEALACGDRSGRGGGRGCTDPQRGGETPRPAAPPKEEPASAPTPGL